MRFERLLIHRCTLISPGQVVGKDRYNRDIREDVPVANVPCRVDSITRRVANDQNGEDIVVQNVLFLLGTQEVVDTMTARDIRDLEGNAVLDGTFSFQDINPIYGRVRLHHYEIALQREGE